MAVKNKMDGYVVVGAIAGGFGVKGEVRLKSFTVDGESIAKYSPLVDENGDSYTITAIRAIKDGYAARFKEIATREGADALRSTRLYALRDRFPELEEDEYYVSDLVGVTVHDGNGMEIGKVKAIQNYGAGDLIEVHFNGKSALIPFTREFVPMVDIRARKIIIEPPNGLLE